MEKEGFHPSGGRGTRLWMPAGMGRGTGDWTGGRQSYNTMDAEA